MINTDFLIERVKEAIALYPSKIELKREKTSDDEMGGYIIDGEEDVATFDGLFDNTGSSLSITISDAAKVEKVSKLSLVVAFSKDFTILKGDYFTLDGVKYKIKNPNLQLNTCYICELEMIE